MVDIRFNENGKLVMVTSVDEKSRNLIYIEKGEMLYEPTVGFPLREYVNSPFTFNYSNILSEISRYLLSHGISSTSVASEIKDRFTMAVKLSVKSQQEGNNVI